MRIVALTLIGSGALTGCARDPVDAECPDLTPGALVITEIRGPQTGDDTLGSWIELYNDSSSAIDLQGITLRFRRQDGSSEINTIVRRSQTVAAGDYVVLGNFIDAMKPAHVDYGFASDFHESFYTSAALEVIACDERIDLARYDSLPRMGTYSLGGAPTAENNDLPASWCFDGTMIASTYPGTPKEANITCP